MNNKIIGLVGFIGSGKGTVGNYLMANHNFKSVSFAGSLKDATSAIFRWPRELLEGDTQESRDWREQKDDYWSNKLGHTVTPRWVLQHLGTDVLRNHFIDEIWIWSLEKHIGSSTDNLVITDVRFPNEIKMISRLNGKMWWVQRGELPAWYDTALNNKHQMPFLYPGVHSSEYEWIGADQYTIIKNDSTLENLHLQINNLV